MVRVGKEIMSNVGCCSFPKLIGRSFEHSFWNSSWPKRGEVFLLSSNPSPFQKPLCLFGSKASESWLSEREPWPRPQAINFKVATFVRFDFRVVKGVVK